MADDLDKLQKRLEDEYGQITRRFDEIHDAMDSLSNGKPGDDMKKLLKNVEKQARQVRTGGLFRPGANQYNRVRRKWLKAKDASSGPQVQKFGN